jgi:hypothetical protein
MDSSVNELEHQRKDLKARVELRDAALKLSSNRDFRKLILDEFLEKEAARNIRLSTDPAMDERQQADCIRAAQASGYLKRFLSYIMQSGAQAESDIRDIDEAIAEARAEEDQEGSYN